jgi:isoquinoline 1-oxidoreductase beta subunit
MWVPLRRAGAAARIMLIAAAAQQWRVDPASCRAQNGAVIHPPTGRRTPYGALVDIAARLPVPTDVPLKSPNEFELIGKPIKRLDSPIKVWGEARFGIDARVPGMLIATVAACPVPGGKLRDVDDSAAKMIAGVRQIMRLDDAVAVVADHTWTATQGLAALDVDWDEGANAKLSTAEIVRRMDAASQNPGVVARKEGDVAQAMGRAATKIEAIYQMPYLAHGTTRNRRRAPDIGRVSADPHWRVRGECQSGSGHDNRRERPMCRRQRQWGRACAGSANRCRLLPLTARRRLR